MRTGGNRWNSKPFYPFGVNELDFEVVTISNNYLKGAKEKKGAIFLL